MRVLVAAASGEVVGITLISAAPWPGTGAEASRPAWPISRRTGHAASVGQATLQYRHSPTREQLLQALSTAARDATAARLAEADLDAVPVPEAIARLARVIAAGGSKYAALMSRFGVSDYASDAEQQIDTMIRALLQRGIDDGTFRGDITAGELQFLLGQLLQAAARMTAEHVAGVEKAAALITSVFLNGTRNRAEPAPRQGQDRG